VSGFYSSGCFCNFKIQIKTSNPATVIFICFQTGVSAFAVYLYTAIPFLKLHE